MIASEPFISWLFLLSRTSCLITPLQAGFIWLRRLHRHSENSCRAAAEDASYCLKASEERRHSSVQHLRIIGARKRCCRHTAESMRLCCNQYIYIYIYIYMPFLTSIAACITGIETGEAFDAWKYFSLLACFGDMRCR